MDIRYEKLANTLVHHSTKLKPQEKVLIHAIDIPRDMVLCLIRAVRDCNAIPFVQVQDGRVDREAAAVGAAAAGGSSWPPADGPPPRSGAGSAAASRRAASRPTPR